MKARFFCLFTGTLLATTLLVEAAETKPVMSSATLNRPSSGFNLLPKAFQRTPDLEMTVNTELTPNGRLFRAPTAEEPIYYISHSSGFKALGDAVAGEKPPSETQMEAVMKRGLAQTGFLPVTTPAQKPSIAVLYFWGSHNRLDRETEANFPVLAARHRIERAILVGGHHEADRMAHIMEWGEWPTDRTPEYEYLRDQALDDLYYVVASAYDYAALERKERKLLWRTTMTVSARGVSMEESLGPLVLAAGPYFGHETKDPVIATRTIQRWGVKIGEPVLIERAPDRPTAK